MEVLRQEAWVAGQGAAKAQGADLLDPAPGQLFLAGMALGEQAWEAVRESALPPTLIDEIAAAKPSSEGHPARVEVETKAQAELVRRLLAIKVDRTDR
jgi:hypothetical protein